MSIIKSLKKIIKKILPAKICSVIRNIRYYILYYRPIFFISKTKNEQLVSIVIPSYKSHKYLREAILSIINQTYKNTEILVMTDVPEEKAKDNIIDLIGRVNYFENKDIHLTDKFNLLIEKAKGNLIIFLAEDDKLDRKFIEKTVNILNKKSVDIVYTDMRRIDNCFERYSAGKWEEKEFLETTPVYITSLFKKEVWEKVGKYKDVIYTDWDFWWRTYKYGFKAYHIKEPLFLYRIHPGQDSYNYNYEETKKKFLEDHRYLISK